MQLRRRHKKLPVRKLTQMADEHLKGLDQIIREMSARLLEHNKSVAVHNQEP